MANLNDKSKSSKKLLSPQEILNQSISGLPTQNESIEQNYGNFSPLDFLQGLGSDSELKKQLRQQQLQKYGQNPEDLLNLIKTEQATPVASAIQAYPNVMPEQVSAVRNIATEIPTEKSQPISKPNETENIKNLLTRITEATTAQKPQQELIKQSTSDIEMQNLLNQYRQDVTNAQVGRTIDKALSEAFRGVGAKMDEEGYKQNLERAGLPLELLEKQRKADTELQAKQKAAEYTDPSSERSKTAREMVKQYLGIAGLNSMVSKINDNMSAEQVDSLTKGIFKDAVDQQMEMNKLQISKQAARESSALAREQKEALAKERAAEKSEKAARLSDKQITEISDFDDTIDRAKDLINLIGDKSEWVGSIDARIPDFIVGADEVAFRSAVGRMSDAYRKLITGAGAGIREIQTLESRLPQPTDTLKNFIAKAKNLISQTEKGKGRHLGNLQKAGKNVEAFQANVPQVESNEVERKDPQSGKIAIFDSNTKKFLRWKGE